MDGRIRRTTALDSSRKRQHPLMLSPEKKKRPEREIERSFDAGDVLSFPHLLRDSHDRFTPEASPAYGRERGPRLEKPARGN